MQYRREKRSRSFVHSPFLSRLRRRVYTPRVYMTRLFRYQTSRMIIRFVIPSLVRNIVVGRKRRFCFFLITYTDDFRFAWGLFIFVSFNENISRARLQYYLTFLTKAPRVYLIFSLVKNTFQKYSYNMHPNEQRKKDLVCLFE